MIKTKTIPRVATPLSIDEIAVALHSIFVASSNSLDVAEFEEELGMYLGCKEIRAFNTGRTALHSALRALSLKPGDEVLIPAYTCAIVIEVVLRLGLRPILVDVSFETYNMDPQQIQKAVSANTKALIPVHLFGQPCEMGEIIEIAKRNDLYVIEDVAQALGAEYNGTKVGTFGDLAIFSFGPGKSMTTGEGGAMAINNEDLMDNVAAIDGVLPEADFTWGVHCFRNLISMKSFCNPYFYNVIKGLVEDTLEERDIKGLRNCQHLLRNEKADPDRSLLLAKMPALCAKVGRLQLKRLNDFNRRRTMNAFALSELLSEVGYWCQLPEARSNVKHTYTRYAIRLLNGFRDDYVRKLRDKGVDSSRPYYYLTKLFESQRVNAPKAMALAKNVFTAPNHPLLTEVDIHKIASVLANELKTKHSSGIVKNTDLHS